MTFWGLDNIVSTVLDMNRSHRSNGLQAPAHEECLDDDDDGVNLRQGVGVTAVKCEMSVDDTRRK